MLIFKKFEKITLITLSLIFFTLQPYYLFIILELNKDLLTESLVCDLNSCINELSKEALLNQLKKMPISCKDVTFRIFGLSLATFNIFISLILSVITIKLFLTYEKNK